MSSGNPVVNMSIYAPVTGKTTAMKMLWEVPMEADGHIFQEWSIISGTPTDLTVVTFVFGYSFTNGGGG